MRIAIYFPIRDQKRGSSQVERKNQNYFKGIYTSLLRVHVVWQFYIYETDITRIFQIVDYKDKYTKIQPVENCGLRA
jgi:hypothetical protein